MSKNVVFCADGTWSDPDETDGGDTPAPTNVFKLFQNLGGADAPGPRPDNERERTLEAADGRPGQIAKYLHGVGDSKNPLAELLGGALGTGLIARIIRGYTFLSRSFAVGDSIFIIGFSRGAYTARALAGLVAAKGLLDAAKIDLTDRPLAYKLGAAVWYAQRQERLQDNPDWLGKLEETVSDVRGFFTSPPPADQLAPVQIEAVAVWDTVGALGIPEYNRQDERVDSLQFADRTLSLKVSHGLHAVSVDEMRVDFTPTLWDPAPRITQVLFPGAHGDIGGGFPETADGSGLSDGPLTWMTGELARLRVQFLTPPAYTARPNAKTTLHRQWIYPPWDNLRRNARAFPKGLRLSRSVLDRIAGGNVPVEGEDAPAPYRPSNLADYVDGQEAAPSVTVVD
jgi:uncharacterized protein (DUF2235 family)